nr:C-type lectin domain-containing receptor 5 [Arenicola marina]
MQRADLGPTMHRAVMATRTQRFVSVVLVVLMLDGGAAQGSAETSRWSHGNVSYHVFSFNDTAGDTWATANEQCEVHGLHLTAVWDQDTQDALNAAPPLASTVNAWLAGRRADNDTFLWLNDEIYEGSLSANYTCAHMLRKNPISRRCHSRLHCLCERDIDPDCPFDEALLGNKCIWSSGPPFTWYNCRNMCIAAGGDLASLSDDAAKVIDELTDKTGVDHYNMYLWVGLHSRQWHWVSGTGQSSSVRTPMEYYHFGASNGYVPANKCLYINMGATDRLWIDVVCHTKLTSFLCDDGPVPVILPPETTSQPTTTTTTEVVNTTIRDVTTPEEKEEDDKQFGLTAGGVAGVAVGFAALLAAIIALSVCLWKSRTKAVPSRVPEVTTGRPKEKPVKLSALETKPSTSTTTIVEDELYENLEREQP